MAENEPAQPIGDGREIAQISQQISYGIARVNPILSEHYGVFRMFKKIAAGFLLLAATSAAASDRALEALASTAGAWEGELYYLDYQSGQRFGIPMRAEIEATPDGATVIRRLTWTDPGNLVYAVLLTTIDRDTGELVEAFFRDGKGEYMRYDVAGASTESATKWHVIYEHNGTDADRPARIRHTIERDGDVMTSKKSVRFLDGDDGEFFERNGSELRLIGVVPAEKKDQPELQ